MITYDQEMFNRIIRQYYPHCECIIRMYFGDEDGGIISGLAAGDLCTQVTNCLLAEHHLEEFRWCLNYS